MAPKAEPSIRQYRDHDQGQVWALAALPAFEGDSSSMPPVPLPDADRAPDAYPDLADIVSSYVLSGGDFVVADVDGDVVGTAGMLPADNRTADVVRVRVHPAMRRRGIGTALLEAIEHRAIELNIRQLNLDTEENPAGAVEFYLASGFQRFDPDDDDSKSRWDLTMFSKPLHHSS